VFHLIFVDLRRRRIVEWTDILANLRSKVNQRASTLNMSNFANKDSLLGREVKPDVMSRTVGLDNNGLIGFQRHIM